MRADRLLSLLLLLQRHRQLSAQALSSELGVSVRTIYRDVEALCAAGIPIYAEYGVNGGYRLVEDYRTPLTGLTNDELNALLMLDIPEPLARLTIGKYLKSALLKLFAALSAHREVRLNGKIYLDWVGWGLEQAKAPHLQKLYEAVFQDYRVRLRYRLWQSRGIEITRVVDPYGLVAKAGAWYLVYSGNGRLHTHLVSDLLNVQVLDEVFERPSSFNLESYWKAVAAAHETDVRRFSILVRVSPELLPWLPLDVETAELQAQAHVLDDDGSGWTRLKIAFRSFESARTWVLGMGVAVEVLEPESLRLSVHDFASQIARMYTAEVHR